MRKRWQSHQNTIHRKVVQWLLTGLICLLMSGSAAGAETAVDEDLTFSLGGTWRLAVSPGGDLYPGYIADPLRPGFALRKLNVTDSEIPGSGTDRYSFTLGGRYGLLRLFADTAPAMAFQIDIYGAFLGQFDIENSSDNIGWDGLYGLILSWSNGNGLALKLAMQHDSSHVGDEYMERTGRERINYTREEWAAGISYRFFDLFRIYGEGGYGYDLRNDALQEPGRVQGGIEIEDRDRFLGGRLGYYAALDVGAYEESDWDADTSVQAGLTVPVDRFLQEIRVGAFYRDGRSPMGEFFQRRERWWGLGLWIDF